MRARPLCLIVVGLAALASHGIFSQTAKDNRFACQSCHLEQMEPPSSMTIASARAEDSVVLRARGAFDRQLGKFHEHIELDHGKAIYTVTDGSSSLRRQLAWSLGSGKMGQAFLYKDGGQWFETQVSYYGSIHGLDMMLGGTPATDISSSRGRRLSDTQVRGCFSCHATSTGDALAPETKLTPGVQCIVCHTPAAQHIRSAEIGKLVLPSTRKTVLTAGAASELCGKCHRTWENVIGHGPHGRDNVRFQPYRLANSKCYNPSDPRISCVACHDPHHPVETSLELYDSKCLACHGQSGSERGGHTAPPCKVASTNCVSCHMPRYTLPQTQESFADHWIRVVHRGEPYPD